MKLENVKIKDLEDDAIYYWKLDGQTVILAGRFIKRKGIDKEKEIFVSKQIKRGEKKNA